MRHVIVQYLIRAENEVELEHARSVSAGNESRSFANRDNWNWYRVQREKAITFLCAYSSVNLNIMTMLCVFKIRYKFIGKIYPTILSFIRIDEHFSLFCERNATTVCVYSTLLDGSVNTMRRKIPSVKGLIHPFGLIVRNRGDKTAAVFLQRWSCDARHDETIAAPAAR